MNDCTKCMCFAFVQAWSYVFALLYTCQTNIAFKKCQKYAYIFVASIENSTSKIFYVVRLSTHICYMRFWSLMYVYWIIIIFLLYGNESVFLEWLLIIFGIKIRISALTRNLINHLLNSVWIYGFMLGLRSRILIPKRRNKM